MDIWGLIFISIFYFFEISTYMTAIKWIYHLEKIKCECSNTFHKKYVKKWIHIYLIVTTLIYLYNVYYIFNQTKIKQISYVFQLPFTLFSMINIIVSIHYIDKLKKTNCECSNHFGREIYYIFSLLKLGILSFFMVILLIITLSIAYSIATNRKTSWWFKFQNMKLEVSNNGISKFLSLQSVEKTKPRNVEFSTPITRK